MNFFLLISCITCNFIAKSQQGIPILDMTAVYERLLKRMTEIERGLNLHLNYNITKTSPREHSFSIYAKPPEDEVKDGERRKETTYLDTDIGIDFLSGDDIPVENHMERTVTMTNRKRIRQKVTNVLSSTVKNAGGTKGPRTYRRSRKKRVTKRKQGRQDQVMKDKQELQNLYNFHKFSEDRDSYTTPPMPPQRPTDLRCGCCTKKTGCPQVPPATLSHSEISSIQKQIDDLIDRGCKVYHFQGSLFYSCENK